MGKIIRMQYNSIPDDPIHDGRVHDIFPANIERLIGNAGTKDKEFYRMLYFDRTVGGSSLFQTVLSVDKEGNINKVPLTDYSGLGSFINGIKTETVSPDELFKDKEEIGLGEEMSLEQLDEIVNSKENELFSKLLIIIREGFKEPVHSREAAPVAVAAAGSPPPPPPTPPTPPGPSGPSTPHKEHDSWWKRIKKGLNQQRCTIYKTKNGNHYANQKDVFNDEGEKITYLPGVGKGKFVKLTEEQLERIRLVYEVTEKQLPEVGVFFFGVDYYMPLDEAEKLKEGGILLHDLSTEDIPTEVRICGRQCRLKYGDYSRLHTLLDVNLKPLRKIEYVLSETDTIDLSTPGSSDSGTSTPGSGPVVPDPSPDAWTPLFDEEDGEPVPDEPAPDTPKEGPVKSKK